jgi:hypothetical protein
MGVFIVGKIGSTPRLQLIDMLHAINETRNDEIYLEVPHIGEWQISADGKTATEIIPSEEILWMEIRRTRDNLLTSCDWTQLPDVPASTRSDWVSYRQALRDITVTYTTPSSVVWPVQPGAITPN